MANSYKLKDLTAEICTGLLTDMDMMPLMIFLLDGVSPEAFPYLAQMFDVEGYKGWDLCTTEEQQRKLLKNALSTKRILGTPYAIIHSLNLVGFDTVILNENVNPSEELFFDGTWNFDGSNMFGSGNWCEFSVDIYVDDINSISDETKDLVIKLINYYKRATAELQSVNYYNKNIRYFDGTWLFDGSNTFNGVTS